MPKAKQFNFKSIITIRKVNKEITHKAFKSNNNGLKSRKEIKWKGIKKYINVSNQMNPNHFQTKETQRQVSETKKPTRRGRTKKKYLQEGIITSNIADREMKWILSLP